MSSEVDFSTIIEMFDNVTRKFEHETRPLLMHKVDGAYRGISFGELRSAVERFAAGLSELGLSHGDTVGIIAENRPEWVVADMGIMCYGAVTVPVYPTFTPKQIEYIFNDAEVKVVVVSNQTQLAKLLKIADNISSLRSIIVMNEKGTSEDRRVLKFSSLLKNGESKLEAGRSPVSEAARTLTPQDLLTIIYTSGTTGNPKGVMLTHENLASNIHSALQCLPFSHEDVLLSFLPLCHSFERMGGYYTAMSCGATIAYAESIDTVRDNLLEIRPTIMTSVPRMFERLHTRIQRQMEGESILTQGIFHWAISVGKSYHAARRNGSPSFALSVQRSLADRLVYRKLRNRTGGRIRFFVSGGAALAREYGEFFEAVGLQIVEGYGLSETSPVISVNRMDKYKFGSVGVPIPGVEVKIAADGEILARGPNIMKGYWNHPDATREAIDNDRWLHTGDIGMFDDQGFLHITDRKKHLFVSSGGKNIAPQHIENLFLQCKYVDQFVLIGDGKSFLTALVVPNMEAVKDFAQHARMTYSTPEELAQRPEIYALLETEFAQLQKELPSYERVRKFTILPAPLTVEEGEITPTLKVKRKVVNEKYKALIDKMYRDGE